MSVSTQIEIAASPEHVRKVLLDFENWYKTGDDIVRSVMPVAGETIPPGEVGSNLFCDFKGMKSVVRVVENTPNRFSWRGDVYYVFSGVHSYSFLPSQITPGHTTFLNSEKYPRLMFLLVGTGLMSVTKEFEGFNVLFKKRVEDGLKEGK